MKRSRESELSGTYYPRGFWTLDKRKVSRFHRIYSWWDGITSDPMFWKLVIYGGAVGFLIVAVSL